MIITIQTDGIVRATPKFPNLMHECASSVLIADYEKLQQAKQELSEARVKVRELEKEVTSLQDLFNNESQVFDIEYGKIEKEVADSDKSQTGDVINRARERH